MDYFLIFYLFSFPYHKIHQVKQWRILFNVLSRPMTSHYRSRFSLDHAWILYRNIVPPDRRLERFTYARRSSISFSHNLWRPVVVTTKITFMLTACLSTATPIYVLHRFLYIPWVSNLYNNIVCVSPSVKVTEVSSASTCTC